VPSEKKTNDWAVNVKDTSFMINEKSGKKVLKINAASPDEDTIRYAAGFLSNGALVAFPTETVYGIGANFLNKKAMQRLRRIKQRPPDKPFTVHISDIGMIKRMRCEITDFAGTLIKEFWPGPLTIILRSKKNSLGFRMPENRIAMALIAESAVPVAAPSANFSGENPPVEAGKIPAALAEKLDLVLDGGRTRLGVESTVVDVTDSPYRILREGAISRLDIERIAYAG